MTTMEENKLILQAKMDRQRLVRAWFASLFASQGKVSAQA